MSSRKNGGLVTIRGRIEKIFYSSPRFSAGVLKPQSGHTIRFAGSLFAREGDRITLHGRYQSHSEYGRQLKVNSSEYDLDMDVDGLANYLANHPEFKGVGPKRAGLIAREFGDEFEQVLLGDDWERIARVGRIPKETVQKIRETWTSNRVFNSAITWLAAFELTHHQVMSLVEKFGASVVSILQTDPYILVQEVPGFGFKRVDRIALKLGIQKNSESRIQAGIIHCVKDALKRGHCFVEYFELIDSANEILIMDELDSREHIEQHLKGLVTCNRLAEFDKCERILVGLPHILSMERFLAAIFLKGKRDHPRYKSDPAWTRLCSDMEESLNTAQREAVVSALSHSITVISGGAGSGKTYTVAAIVAECSLRNLAVAMAAPTGKAAKRMEEMVGHRAKTIHRLLEYGREGFRRSRENPLDMDVVIIDEFSMVDVELAFRLFDAIDLSRTSVVLVGDHNQLPPIGPGNILRDLIRNRVLTTVVLDRVMRQAGVLKKNCIWILHGQVEKSSARNKSGRRPWMVVDEFSKENELQQFLISVFDEVIADKLKYDPLRDVQVLTPTHKGPLGTKALNLRLQRLLQKKLWNFDVPALKPGRRPKLYLHDRVIQTKNDYEIDVMNGTVGIVDKIEAKGALVIDFDGRRVRIEPNTQNIKNLELAYCMSIHKSQGSEYRCAIVVIHKSHSIQHHRNLFYTAVTRAKESAIVIGDRWGIRNCAKKKQVNNRNTFLPYIFEEDTYTESMRAEQYSEKDIDDGDYQHGC
ncbi:MAG: AAA family ATPase [Deltaproteobacteria bacterium]|nr:AAA family ATPase [Deltaproteobacteria bacterium]